MNDLKTKRSQEKKQNHGIEKTVVDDNKVKETRQRKYQKGFAADNQWRGKIILEQIKRLNQAHSILGIILHLKIPGIMDERY